MNSNMEVILEKHLYKEHITQGEQNNITQEKTRNPICNGNETRRADSICNICESRFPNENELKNHVRDDHEFKCHFCGQSFPTNKEFDEHS